MEASFRKAATPRYRTAPRSNERRLVTQHPRRRILSLAAGAAALDRRARRDSADLSVAPYHHRGGICSRGPR